MHTCMRVCACARVWRERGRAHASSNDPHSPSPSRRASEVGRAGLRETESEVVAACPPVVTGGTAALSWAFPWDCPEVAELESLQKVLRRQGSPRTYSLSSPYNTSVPLRHAPENAVVVTGTLSFPVADGYFRG